MERYVTDLVILNEILWMGIINYEYSIYTPTSLNMLNISIIQNINAI